VKVKDTRGRVNHVWHTDSILRGIARTTSPPWMTLRSRVALMETVEIGEKNGSGKNNRDPDSDCYTRYYSSQSLRAVGRCLSCEEDVRRANETLSPYCETPRRPP